jgi:acetylornithine/succinyldiaminopimelate/putrescine aminotransferase
MIKLARKWGSENGKYEIIVMENSFHGRTLATLAATGRKKYREGFAPDMPGFVFVPYNDINALKSAFTEKTCAVFLEPVQGEGGVLPADKEYLHQVRKECTERKALLMFDEVQTGIGRTGEFFAWKKYEVEPDLFSAAKALGNGFPIGAFIVKEEFTSVLGPGTHASTFGGTPLACAASIAVLDTIRKESILANCREKSEIIFNRLKKFEDKFDIITGLRGMGLMIGIVLNRNAAPLRQAAAESGLLVLTAGENVLRLLPPLNVTSEEVDTALNLLEQAFEKFTNSRNN